MHELMEYVHLSHKISHLTHMISPHYPILIIGLIFIAVIVLLILLYWLFKAIRRNLKRIKWPKKGPLDTSYEQEDYLTPYERLQKSKIYRLKKFFGFVTETPTDELARSFAQMKIVVEDMVGGVNPLYKMPLYLAIGAQESAKATILQQSGLGSPFELDMMNERNQEMSKYWWFFDQALVLKAPGSSILSKDSSQSDIALWRHLLSLLERYRPNRPLDGIVLTIPCDELIGKNKLDLGMIQERARVIYTKLLQLQSSFGICAPVYVVVTKTDSIFGFESFCREIPNSSLHEIFGWSSPYGTNQTYSSSWIEEAFHQMDARLQKIILEVYTENANIPEADGLYVFSTSFREIKDTLNIYLSEIFKTSNLHDPMIFRGVYFTGDATIPEYEGINISDQIVQNITRPQGLSQPSKVRLYFLKELFSNKVFLESSLARGTHKSIKHNKTTLNAAKVILMLTVLAGTVETLSLHYSMNSKKGALLNALRQIQETTQSSTNISDKMQNGFDEEKFKSQGKMLIEFINTYENTRFSSPLVPSTWFSSASDKIETVLAIAFDELVLKSLSFDLKLKAEKIIQGLALDAVPGTFNSPGLSKSRQFVVLETFVKDIEKFESIINKYNEFTQTKDRRHLEPVVNYLFGSIIPKSFFEHISGQISETLKWGEYYPMDFEIFQTIARTRFEELLVPYLNSIFGTENYAVLKYMDLSKSLEALGDRQTASKTSIEEIQKLEVKAQEVIEAIEHKEFDWLNKSKFELDETLNKMVTKINNSRLLGKDQAEEFKKRTNLAFIKFKTDLPDLGLDLTGSIFALEKGSTIAAPSSSFQKLYKSLSELSKEAFILKTEGKKSVTPPPPGKIIMWDLKALQHASNLITSYDQFIQNKLGNYPTQLQNVVQFIGLRALQINVMNLVIKSMVMDIPPKSASSGTPEEALKPIIENLKNALPHLTRILPTLNSESVGENFMALQSILVNQYYGNLGALEGILQTDGLYKVKNGNFDWWTGSGLLNAKAFNSSDVEDLKNYLHVQANRILFLTKEFAIPLLTVFQIPGLQVNQLNMPLISKWTRILDQSSGYEKKKPDSSMLVLENYIINDLTPITGKNCIEKLGTVPEGNTLSGDFFVSVKQTISRQVFDRCKVINIQNAIKAYEKITTMFNLKLAGKFPFSETMTNDEAKEKDIQDLYTLFNDAGGNADKIIAALPENEPNLQLARRFLKTLEELKIVFEGFVGEKPVLKKPSYTLNIQFRANKSQEIGGSSIVDWFFSVGKQTVASRGKEGKISWTYGDPIMVSFKWASGGTLKPAFDPAQPGMAVEDRMAAFSVTSKWSLFRLIRLFSATPGEVANNNENISNMLRFTIPTLTVPSGNPVLSDRKDLVQGTPAETARVYVHVEIETTKKAGGNIITLPMFPSGAPILSEETRAFANPPKLSIPGQSPGFTENPLEQPNG